MFVEGEINRSAVDTNVNEGEHSWRVLCIEEREREKEEREVEKWSGGGVQFFPELGQ